MRANRERRTWRLLHLHHLAVCEQATVVHEHLRVFHFAVAARGGLVDLAAVDQHRARGSARRALEECWWGRNESSLLGRREWGEREGGYCLDE